MYSQIGALDGSGGSFIAFSFAAIARYRLFSYLIGGAINPFGVELAWWLAADSGRSVKSKCCRSLGFVIHPQTLNCNKLGEKHQFFDEDNVE